MARISRRVFVHSSLAAGAGLSLGTRTAFAEPGPNDKIGIAVVGVGGRGGNHVDGFMENPLSEVRYIVDVDESTV
jgi:cell division GTPase FtsZ